jgi:hypothetical protein
MSAARCAHVRRTAHRVHHRTGEAPFGPFTGPWILAWRERRGLRYGGARLGVRKGT